MTDFSVSTAADQIANLASLVQNLGPDDLYIDITTAVTSGTGLRVSVGDSVAVGGGHTYYGISGGTSDVRVLAGGTGGPASLATA